MDADLLDAEGGTHLTCRFAQLFGICFDIPQYSDNFWRHTIYIACTMRIIL